MYSVSKHEKPQITVSYKYLTLRAIIMELLSYILMGMTSFLNNIHKAFALYCSHKLYSFITLQRRKELPCTQSLLLELKYA